MWALAALLACTASDTETDEPLTPEQVVDELRAVGPYGVGYRESELTYDAVRSEGRTLRLALWYPTNSNTGAEVRYRGLFPAPEVLGDADVADGSFPVLVFAHGHQGYAENSARLIEHITSHGWVVVSPDHTGNTTFDGPDRETSIYVWRGSDTRAAVQHLRTQDPLADSITDELGAMGHSFGGYHLQAMGGATFLDSVIDACLDGSDTSAFCSTMDDEWAGMFRAGLGDHDDLSAIVTMAPGDYRLFEAGLADMSVPVMHHTGAFDTGHDNDDTWLAFDHADDVRVHMPRAGHQSYTDVAGSLGAADDELPPEEGWDIIQTTSLAYLRAMVLNDASAAAAYDGSVDWTSEAEFSSH